MSYSETYQWPVVKFTNIGSVFVLYIVKAGMLHLGNSCIFYEKEIYLELNFPEARVINKKTTY